MASGRARRESNKYASDDEEDVSRPKKRKKKAAKKECVAAGEAAKKKAKGSSKKKGKAARVCHMTVSTEGAGAAVTLTSRDAAMTSQRRLRTALADAEYDMELVPDAARDLEGSFLERVEGTAAWERRICEIMLLCNEAAWRRVSRERSRPGPEKGANIPTSKARDLGRVPLVSTDFWTSDHLSERSRSVRVLSGTRGAPALSKRR